MSAENKQIISASNFFYEVLSMIRVALQSTEIGMKVAKPVYDIDGRILLARGVSSNGVGTSSLHSTELRQITGAVH